MTDLLAYLIVAIAVVVCLWDTRRRYDQPAGRRNPRRWWRND